MATTRLRGASYPTDLMMLAMFYLQNECTLLEISEAARIMKLREMSDVAFMSKNPTLIKNITLSDLKKN